MSKEDTFDLDDVLHDCLTTAARELKKLKALSNDEKAFDNATVDRFEKLHRLVLMMAKERRSASMTDAIESLTDDELRNALMQSVGPLILKNDAEDN